MKCSLFSLLALCFCLIVNASSLETVPVDDYIVKTMARKASYKIRDGAQVSEIKSAVRKPVPAGWKYTIIMDVTTYGSYVPKECIVDSVYDVISGDMWLTNPDPLYPVPCEESKR